MHIPWKNLGKIGVGLLSTYVPAVGLAVNIAEQIPGLHGKDKQDAVVALVKASVEATEGLSGKDVLNDPEVEAATRGLSDAIVHLQNVLTKKVPVPA